MSSDEDFERGTLTRARSNPLMTAKRNAQTTTAAFGRAVTRTVSARFRRSNSAGVSDDDGDTLEVSDRVEIQGLINTPRFNGMTASVLGLEGERYVVQLVGGEELKVRKANLRYLIKPQVTDRVLIRGLVRVPRFNDELADVEEEHGHKFTVRLVNEQGRTLLLKWENLVVVETTRPQRKEKGKKKKKKKKGRKVRKAVSKLLRGGKASRKDGNHKVAGAKEDFSATGSNDTPMSTDAETESPSRARFPSDTGTAAGQTNEQYDSDEHSDDDDDDDDDEDDDSDYSENSENSIPEFVNPPTRYSVEYTGDVVDSLVDSMKNMDTFDADAQANGVVSLDDMLDKIGLMHHKDALIKENADIDNVHLFSSDDLEKIGFRLGERVKFKEMAAVVHDSRSASGVVDSSKSGGMTGGGILKRSHDREADDSDTSEDENDVSDDSDDSDASDASSKISSRSGSEDDTDEVEQVSAQESSGSDNDDDDDDDASKKDSDDDDDDVSVSSSVKESNDSDNGDSDKNSDDASDSDGDASDKVSDDDASDKDSDDDASDKDSDDDVASASSSVQSSDDDAASIKDSDDDNESNKGSDDDASNKDSDDDVASASSSVQSSDDDAASIKDSDDDNESNKGSDDDASNKDSDDGAAAINDSDDNDTASNKDSDDDAASANSDDDNASNKDSDDDASVGSAQRGSDDEELASVKHSSDEDEEDGDAAKDSDFNDEAKSTYDYSSGGEEEEEEEEAARDSEDEAGKATKSERSASVTSENTHDDAKESDASATDEEDDDESSSDESDSSDWSTDSNESGGEVKRRSIVKELGKFDLSALRNVEEMEAMETRARKVSVVDEDEWVPGNGPKPEKYAKKSKQTAKSGADKSDNKRRKKKGGSRGVKFEDQGDSSTRRRRRKDAKLSASEDKTVKRKANKKLVVVYSGQGAHTSTDVDDAEWGPDCEAVPLAESARKLVAESAAAASVAASKMKVDERGEIVVVPKKLSKKERRILKRNRRRAAECSDEETGDKNDITLDKDTKNAFGLAMVAKPVGTSDAALQVAKGRDLFVQEKTLARERAKRVAQQYVEDQNLRRAPQYSGDVATMGMTIDRHTRPKSSDMLSGGIDDFFRKEKERIAAERKRKQQNAEAHKAVHLSADWRSAYKDAIGDPETDAGNVEVSVVVDGEKEANKLGAEKQNGHSSGSDSSDTDDDSDSEGQNESDHDGHERGSVLEQSGIEHSVTETDQMVEVDSPSGSVIENEASESVKGEVEQQQVKDVESDQVADVVKQHDESENERWSSDDDDSDDTTEKQQERETDEYAQQEQDDVMHAGSDDEMLSDSEQQLAENENVTDTREEDSYDERSYDSDAGNGDSVDNESNADSDVENVNSGAESVRSYASRKEEGLYDEGSDAGYGEMNVVHTDLDDVHDHDGSSQQEEEEDEEEEVVVGSQVDEEEEAEGNDEYDAEAGKRQSDIIAPIVNADMCTSDISVVDADETEASDESDDDDDDDEEEDNDDDMLDMVRSAVQPAFKIDS